MKTNDGYYARGILNLCANVERISTVYKRTVSDVLSDVHDHLVISRDTPALDGDIYLGRYVVTRDKKGVRKITIPRVAPQIDAYEVYRGAAGMLYLIPAALPSMQPIIEVD